MLRALDMLAKVVVLLTVVPVLALLGVQLAADLWDEGWAEVFGLDEDE